MESGRLWLRRYGVGVLIALSTLAWRPGDSSWQNVWVERWGFLALIGVLILIAEIPWRHWIFPLFLTYVSVMAMTAAWFEGYFSKVDMRLVNMLRPAAEDHLILILVLLVILYARVDLRKPLYWLGILTGLGIFWVHPATGDTQVPVLMNPSMSATFVVLATSFSPFSLCVAGVAKSWTAFGVWSIGIIFRLLSKMRFWPALGVVCLFGAVVALGCYFGPDGVSDRGRFWVWGQSWQIFDRAADPLHQLFGSGAGSVRVWLPFRIMLPLIGETIYLPVWIWSHNDYLQYLVEYGVIGAALGLSALLALYRYASGSDRGLILGYGAAMVTNFPTHWPLTALVGWMIVSRCSVALEIREEEVDRAGVQVVPVDLEVDRRSAGRSFDVVRH